MKPKGFHRKLTAILSADVAGYGRLMRGDETATVKTLEAYKQVFFDLIQQHHGRVVDSPGDNLLAEFASVVDAVQCAIAVQKELKSREADLPESRRMRFRIGINLGDIIQEGPRIYGDGVNIAARLESLADPGGICISKTAFDQVESKLPLKYECLGEQTVKNIEKPVGVYRIVLKPRVTQRKPEGRSQPNAGKGRWKYGVAALIVSAVSGVLVWQAALRFDRLPENALMPGQAVTSPSSIAVLPFTNMSDDPQQEYFSDGISEDLITDLSKISGLTVIARTSSFMYKRKSLDVQQIGKSLRVQYLLEGSVRKAGDQVRINAQLIDASTGNHLWAERYDGKLEDVFALQDKITRKIIVALALKLTAGEESAIADKGTDNPAAYDEYLRGWQSYRLFTNDGFAAAKMHLEKALELDPDFSRAYAAMAVLYWKAIQMAGLKQGLGLTSQAAIVEATAKSLFLVKMALRRPVALAHGLMSQIYLYRRLHNEAVAEIERAVAMDPSNPELYAMMANTLWFAGQNDEAIKAAQKGLRLDPNNPAEYLWYAARVALPDGNLLESLTLLNQAEKLNPDLSSAIGSTRCMIYGILGRDQEARIAYEVFRKGRVDSPVLKTIMIYLPFAEQTTSDRIAEALLRAGVPGELSDNFQISRNNLLTGPEIESLLFGGKIGGSTAEGGHFSLEINHGGECNLIREAPQGILRDTGKSWIEGDVLFVQLQRLSGGRPYGNTIFRKTGGTRQNRDEYYIVSDLRAISSFSRID